MRPTNRLRLGIVCGIVALAAAAVGARLVQLQVVRAAGFRALADRQHVNEVVVPARRGSIVDRHGCELAVSLASESLYAHPWRVEDPDAVARALAPVLGRSATRLRRKLTSDKSFVWVARFLDHETAETIRGLGLAIGPDKGLNFETEPKRVYPRGRLAADIVGFAGIDGDGLEGIELRYDARLKGDPTVYLAVKDARLGRVMRRISEPARIPGDIVLTIDDVVQHIVERELDRAIRESGARGASAIVLDPTTGDVLAMANRPAHAPGERSRRRSDVVRAAINGYEPGSTFKVVPMALALDAGVVHPGQRIDCGNGSAIFGRRTIRDSSAHGVLTLREVMAHSSNIGMVKVTRRLDARALEAGIRRFGFGERTGLELPGEADGLFAPRSRWSGYTRDSLAFGQEISVTLPQMAAAFATIANDGVRVPPRLVLGLRDADGKLHLDPPREGLRVVAPRAAAEVRAMLEQVIDDGTGSRAEIPGYRVGGKSGTAQKAVAGHYSDHAYVASFGGLAPIDRPRAVVLVVLDTPRGEWHQGGRVAAPVFARILRDTLLHLRVPQDDGPFAPSDVRTASIERRPTSVPAPELAEGRTPDVLGLSLREALDRLTGAGCRATVSGHGFVERQRPAAGKEIPADGECRIVLRDRSAEGAAG